jgi:hypothetical protein
MLADPEKTISRSTLLPLPLLTCLGGAVEHLKRLFGKQNAPANETHVDRWRKGRLPPGGIAGRMAFAGLARHIGRTPKGAADGFLV